MLPACEVSALPSTPVGPADVVTAASPGELNSYVGRRAEGAEVRRLLGSARLVTLTGAGGVGKTRLATRVMRDAARAYPDGVVFVELAQLRDGKLVANLVADRLGLRDRPARSATRNVIDHLRDRAMLLVLDNCEHVIGACAEFATAVLTECPRVVLLATSRQSLAVLGEQVWPVPPLETAAAVQLFVDRAVAVRPEAAASVQTARAELVELCRQLDGLPLAIELAAARIRSLSPGQILHRLTGRLALLTIGPRSVPGRQQTLRAAIDWSYELCSPAEQVVWARVSVFAGTFDLDAAKHVCTATDLAPDTVLELIDGLLDKSVLVRREQDGRIRYQMLETLREYGQERLAQDGDQVRVARLHRDYFDRLTTRADKEWESRQTYWLERLRADDANLRVAMDWSLAQQGEAGAVLRMAGRPFEYWLVRGLAGETRMWLERALAAAPPDHPERALALCIGALYVMWLGDLDQAARLVAEAEELAATGGDEVLRAHILHARSFAAMLAAKPESVDLAAEACAVFCAHGLVRAELHPLFIYGVSVAYRDRDLAAARGSLSRMYDVATACGTTFYQAMSLFGTAMVEVEFGDVDVAADAAEQALRLDLRTGDRHGRAYRADTLAWVADRRGDHVRAATLFGVAATNWDRIGTSPDFAVSIPHRRHYKHARAALGDARFDEAFAHGRAMTDDEAMTYALGEPPLPATAAAAPSSPLTKRESEVAQLVAEGLTDREIAARLVISLRTASTHVQHILTKLGFNNRAQVAAWVAAGHGQEP